MREDLQNCFEEQCLRTFPETRDQSAPRCEARQKFLIGSAHTQYNLIVI